MKGEAEVSHDQLGIEIIGFSLQPSQQPTRLRCGKERSAGCLPGETTSVQGVVSVYGEAVSRWPEFFLDELRSEIMRFLFSKTSPQPTHLPGG